MLLASGQYITSWHLAAQLQSRFHEVLSIDVIYWKVESGLLSTFQFLFWRLSERNPSIWKTDPLDQPIRLRGLSFQTKRGCAGAGSAPHAGCIQPQILPGPFGWSHGT